MKRDNASGSMMVEVGLFGLHTKISRVRSVTAANIPAFESKVWSVSGTLTAVAPETCVKRRVQLGELRHPDHLVAHRGDLIELLAQG